MSAHTTEALKNKINVLIENNLIQLHSHKNVIIQETVGSICKNKWQTKRSIY